MEAAISSETLIEELLNTEATHIKKPPVFVAVDCNFRSNKFCVPEKPIYGRKERQGSLMYGPEPRNNFFI